MAAKAPRFVVRYEDSGLFKLALQRVGGNIDLIEIDVYQQERETSTLPAAKSVRRALERRGHLVRAIYERVNIRESEEWHSEEYRVLHRGRIEWQWDEEWEIDEEHSSPVRG